jgi:hypothetical protein
MALPIFQRTIVNDAGDVIPGASVEVRRESDNALVQLFSDRDGTVLLPNPTTADGDGFVQFFAASSNYKITATGSGGSVVWRYVDIGSADLQADLAADTGSSLVGADDAASGSLFTTVQGFITLMLSRWTALYSSAGAALVGFIQSGAGAIFRTVQDELRERVSITQFGATAGTGDSTAAIQAAVNTGKVATVPAGVFFVSAPIYLPRGGASIIGTNELGFAQSVIKPLPGFTGAALFVVNGDTETGGWGFRNRLKNLLLWCSDVSSLALPNVISVNKAYTIYLEKIWFHDVPGSAIQLSANNHIHINKCLLGGRSNVSSPFGINALSDSADNAGGGIFINDTDIENFQVGVDQKTNARVTLNNAYTEGCGIAWRGAGNASGKLDVIGGRFIGINASTICGSINGPNITVIGGSYTLNGGSGIRADASNTRHANVQVYGVPEGVFTRHRNMYQLNNKTDVAAGWVLSESIHKKTFEDAVAADLFTVVCPANAEHTGFLEVEVFARMSGNNSIVSRSKFTFTFSNTGSAVFTPLIESEKSGTAGTGNWSLDITGAVVVSGGNVSLQLTCDTGGALGNARQTVVSAQARMVTPVATGGIYLIAA